MKLYSALGCVAYLSSALGQSFEEARDKTRVTVSSTLWDTKTSAQGGCGTDGCRPALIYDNSLAAESRWSCQQPLDPDSYQECWVFFDFYEPQHMAQLQIAFYQGNKRKRTVEIVFELAGDNGDFGGFVSFSYTSTGKTVGFETISAADYPEVDTEKVQAVSIGFSTSIPYKTWLSINEVKLQVYGVTCEESNQACADDVADRLSASTYLYRSDEELWDLLVNGKGIGLCNIRVAGEGEDTDLYAYSGVMQPEGNHGYPDGANAGYVSTPDWPSGSPGSAAVCADYEALYGESKFCGTNGRTNAVAQMRDAISSAHCCLSY